MARKDTLIGFDDLMRDFEKLGKVPQSAATRGAQAAGRLALKAAKANAPVDTGELRDGIILKGERNRDRGKKVYDIMMDPAKNDVFVKMTKDGKRAYYPASQEYGFLTVDGRYIPGYGFLRRAIDDNAEQIERKVLEVAGREVDKALRKSQAKRR
jgi:phage protein, HK97 gp10 family